MDKRILKDVSAPRFAAPAYAEEDPLFTATFLNAQVNSSIDGILVVDSQGRKLLQNQRMNEIWEIPPEIANDPDDTSQVKFVSNAVQNPEEFAARIGYLYAHPDETDRVEVHLKNGKILDRYSAPVLGEDGECYGRIWTFRDVTKARRPKPTFARAKKSSACLPSTFRRSSSYAAWTAGTSTSTGDGWNTRG